MNLFVAMHLFNLFGFVFKILLDVIIYRLGRFFPGAAMTIVHRTIIEILLLVLLLIVDTVHDTIRILAVCFLDAIALLRK